MLSNFSQFSPQGFGPQLPGFQAGGPGQFNPAAFGQHGLFGGNAPFGQEAGHFGAGQQQYPFGSPPGSLAQHPFGPFGTSPYGLQSPQLQNQLLPMLGHIAQQVALQTAITQQIGFVLHQLAQQLGVYGSQAQQGFGLGTGQAFAGGQPFGGFTPQTQGWGGGRSQTIQ